MDMLRLESITSLQDFDEFEEFIFAQDRISHRIIYYNKAYQALLEKKVEVLPTFDDRFLSLRAYVRNIGGKEYIIQVAERVLPYRQKVDSHDVRIAISDVENILRTEMQSNFLFQTQGRSYHDTLIDRIVDRALEYYDCPLAQLVQFSSKRDNESTLIQYFAGKEKPLVSSLTLDPFVRQYHNAFFRCGFSLLSEDVRDFFPLEDGLSEKMLERGVHSLINIPYFTEGKLSGFLVLANPGGDSEKIDFFFADFAANAVGTMAYRGVLYANMYIDETTGFPWSSAIGMFYPKFVKAHSDIPIAMFEFDFLHFRMVSRTYGGSIGDAILRKTADILREKYPSSILSRKNGTDVFLVVTTGIAESLSIEAHKIIDEIQQAFPNIMMTLAFGIYQVKDTREEFDYSVLKTSFAHRYAKEDPLGRVKIFDETMDKRESLSVYFANHFRPSLENGEFLVYIQPKYNLEDETYFGGEALVRWRLGDILVPPTEFIPQFEANGLSRELDLFVLKKACQIVAKWLREAPETAVPISVNFSRVDFADPHLFESILFVINEVGIPASYIEIEITESAYVDYEKQIISFIQKCHAADMKVLMDDFGSGVSSFNSLKNLDIDCIKLDYKFLSGGGDNHKKRKIIEGIIALARAIRVPVVVEGVETKTEAAFFRALGVRYVQGFLFGKPMPVEKFEEIRNRTRGLIFHGGDDPRMMLHEILDTNSNLNFFFDNINKMMGVFRFDGQTLYPVLINRRTEQAIASIGTIPHFMQSDLLSYFDEDRRQTIRECLGAEHRSYVFSERKIYQFHIGSKTVPVYMQGLLVQVEPNGNRFYLLTADTVQDSGIIPYAEKGDSSLSWLMESKIQGCAILDAEGYIIAHNDFLKHYYPMLQVGVDAESVFQHHFDSQSNLHRAYIESREIVFDVAARQITYYGEKATLLVFSELGDPGSYISEIGGDGFKFYDRLVSTVRTIAVCYVEIDLEGDTFFQVNFKEHDDFAYHDAINHGSYTDDLYQRFLEAVGEGELAEVRERMRLDNLIEACKAMSPFTLSYKLHGGRLFHRLQMRFYYDKGHHYACFFLEDITEERLRDYDRLTGCLGRTAGVALMERHIIEHPLDKMAFFILDIDDFKMLNDTYGHPLGDRVLAKIHDAFQKLPETYDYSTRLGGDEFCLLLTKRNDDFDIEKARMVIDQCLRNIGFQVGLNKEIHASIGCALIPEDGGSVSNVYPRADSNLYDQKKLHKAER